jgi:hypothetical protein
MKAVRFALGDTERIQYSDYEILQSLNQVLRIVSNQLAALQSGILVKPNVEIELPNGSGELPEDFIAMADSPEGTIQDYRILGNHIAATGQNIKIGYYSALPPVKQEGDNIALPSFFQPLLENFTKLHLLKKPEASDPAFNQMLYIHSERLIANREYASIPDGSMPFFV